jgi:glucose/arabinose dehydrogenase
LPQLKNIYANGETGAMAMVKDDEWDQGKKYIYVYFGSKEDKRMRLSRFMHEEKGGGLQSRASYYSQKTIWKDTDGWGKDPQWHYGGSLNFGPDGHIYLTLGDKYTDWMLLSNKHYSGCVVRVTKQGDFPSGNLPSHIKPAGCWAHGLRNGYSATWDLETDRFLIAEVGGNSNENSYEDVHLGKQGAHFGWPHCEGKAGNNDFPKCNTKIHDDPIYTYAHSGKNKCIIGGPVLRNKKWPAKYDGAYWLADFSDGRIFYLSFDGENKEQVTKKTEFSSGHKGIISMTTDYQGNIWTTSWYTSWNGGGSK